MNTQWTYAPDPRQPEKSGLPRPAAVRNADGYPVAGVDDGRMPTYGWYPERPRSPLPPYSRGWLPMTVIDVEAGDAYYVPDLPDEAERLAMAMAALEYRIGNERERLVTIATTGMDQPDIGDVGKMQRAALMKVAQLQRKESRGLATAGEIAVLDMMDEIPGAIMAIDQARADIAAWVRTNIAAWPEADAFDPREPPEECPQWPQ